MRRTAAFSSLCLALAALTYAPAPAVAADFCAGKISPTNYYQRNFSHGGQVVATICAPGYNVAGNAYLYARGSYANVSKYMKLTIRTNGGSPVTADGNFYSYVYHYRGNGGHWYHAVMYDGNGNKIVDGTGMDYE